MKSTCIKINVVVLSNGWEALKAREVRLRAEIEIAATPLGR
jgi:hypothetical protein